MDIIRLAVLDPMRLRDPSTLFTFRTISCVLNTGTNAKSQRETMSAPTRM